MATSRFPGVLEGYQLRWGRHDSQREVTIDDFLEELAVLCAKHRLTPVHVLEFAINSTPVALHLFQRTYTSTESRVDVIVGCQNMLQDGAPYAGCLMLETPNGSALEQELTAWYRTSYDPELITAAAPIVNAHRTHR